MEGIRRTVISVIYLVKEGGASSNSSFAFSRLRICKGVGVEEGDRRGGQ